MRFEGFSSRVYRCPAGYPTIGYGHMLKESETGLYPEDISNEAAILLLEKDLRIASSAVCRLVNIGLSEGQFDALVSFTFNLGSAAFQRSTLRQKVNREEHGQAIHEFPKWVWAGGCKQKGLIRRRYAEARLYGA